jgi:hypothetical protein
MKIYRHGDVLLREVVANSVASKISGMAVLADGEVTGHKHVLTAPRIEQWVLDLHRYVKLDAVGVLDHPEHGEIAIDSGTYEVIIQRVYSPEAIRNVAD